MLRVICFSLFLTSQVINFADSLKLNLQFAGFSASPTHPAYLWMSKWWVQEKEYLLKKKKPVEFLTLNNQKLNKRVRGVLTAFCTDSFIFSIGVIMGNTRCEAGIITRTHTHTFCGLCGHRKLRIEPERLNKVVCDTVWSKARINLMHLFRFIFCILTQSKVQM